MLSGDNGQSFVFVAGVKGAGHHLVNGLLLWSPNLNMMRELGICGAWDDGEEAELFRLMRLLFEAHHDGLFGFPPIFGHVQDCYDKVVKILRTMRWKFVLRKWGGG